MRRLLGVLVAAASLALAAPATAAEAATYRVTDPTGDVRNLVVEQDSPDYSSSPAARDAEPDVTSFEVRHGARAVTLRTRVAELVRPTARQGLVVALVVKGSNGQRRYVQALRGALAAKERPTQVFRFSDGRNTCGRAARSTFDYAEDLVTVTAPRRCFGAPARIKVTGYVLRGADTRDDNTLSRLTYDNLLETGGEADVFGRRFTPWVARG